MKSYDNAVARTYSLGSIDFTSAAALSIAVPSWAKGARIEGVSVDGATVAFTADTTGAFVDVGTATDADKFMHAGFGVIAATDSAYAENDINAGLEIQLGYDGDAGAALTQLEVSFVAPTGGTPGGTGLVNLTIHWY